MVSQIVGHDWVTELNWWALLGNSPDNPSKKKKPSYFSTFYTSTFWNVLLCFSESSRTWLLTPVPIYITSSSLISFNSTWVLMESEVKVLVMSDFLGPHRLKLSRLLCPWNSAGKNNAVCSHLFLQGIFPIQGLKLGLLHSRWILSHLSYHRSPWVLVKPWKYQCFPAEAL